MSKYADIEQIKKVIRTEWVKYMPSDLDINLSFVLGKISEVPTIEVSEGCISRKWLEENKQVVSHTNEWGETEINEYVYWEDVENAPSVVLNRAEAEE